MTQLELEIIFVAYYNIALPYLRRPNDKVMLHGTICNDDFIFSATQRCNIAATLFRIVTTLFQHCNDVLR